MANSNNWGEIYKSTWWGDKAWSANTLFIDSAPPGFGLNLLKASEDMDNTLDWITRTGASVSAQNTNDPNGELTAERVDFAADVNSRIQQLVTLEASTTYTFSVHAKVPSGSQDFRLKALGVTGVGSFTALSSDWTRFDFDFTTTTAGTYTLAIMNATDGAARSIQFWGAMLNEGADVGGYVKTEASVGGSSPTPEYSGFGDEFVGVTAYYSLRQFTEAETLNAIRVRRSSDDTEQDIGFDANGDLDSTALLAFVNADVNQYTSDFSSTEDLNESNGTGAAAQSIGGVDDAYKFTLSGGSATHFAEKISLFEANALSYDIEFQYYIPSGNANCDGIKLNFITDAPNFTNLDSWTSVQLTDVQSATSGLRFYASDGGSISVNADGDVFYLKNIVVTQTTADGAVTTFYDQTGNGNDATNSTESEQPLVVSGGTLLEENSKAAVDFDGVNDMLQKDFDPDIAQPLTLFHVRRYRSNGTFCAIGYDNSTGSGYADINVALDFRSYYGSYLGTTTQNTDQGLWYSLANGASSEVGLDGAAAETGNAGTAGLEVLTIGSAFGAFDAPINTQEIIIFDSDQSTNRTGIETNINDHFDIYTP